MLVDWSGGVFSVLSLVFKEKFDIIAGVTYSAVVVSLLRHLQGMFVSESPLRHGAGTRRFDPHTCCDLESKSQEEKSSRGSIKYYRRRGDVT